MLQLISGCALTVHSHQQKYIFIDIIACILLPSIHPSIHRLSLLLQYPGSGCWSQSQLSWGGGRDKLPVYNRAAGLFPWDVTNRHLRQIWKKEINKNTHDLVWINMAKAKLCHNIKNSTRIEDFNFLSFLRGSVLEFCGFHNIFLWDIGLICHTTCREPTQTQSPPPPSFARSKKGDNLLLPPLRLAPPVSPVALGFGCFDVLPHSPAWASLACCPVFGFFHHTLQSALPVYHSVPLQGSVPNNT